VDRLEEEADAIRKLDSLALEDTAGLPEAKAAMHQEKSRKLALDYATQYQQDMGKLIKLPMEAVDWAFQPSFQAESAASPGGGIYQTMFRHQRLARASSKSPWWHWLLFWQSKSPASSIPKKPSRQQIIQDYQSLRYLPPPERRRK